MATTDSYGQGVSISSLTDKPDAETLAKNIANGIASRSVLRFASAAADEVLAVVQQDQQVLVGHRLA
ncbi:hypothetical protein ABZ869_34240, partial [Streptomyces sp. NPDC046928]